VSVDSQCRDVLIEASTGTPNRFRAIRFNTSHFAGFNYWMSLNTQWNAWYLIETKTRLKK